MHNNTAAVEILLNAGADVLGTLGTDKEDEATPPPFFLFWDSHWNQNPGIQELLVKAACRQLAEHNMTLADLLTGSYQGRALAIFKEMRSTYDQMIKWFNQYRQSLPSASETLAPCSAWSASQPSGKNHYFSQCLADAR